MGYNEDLFELGQFMRNIRVGRGITLKEAAGDWSPATLSRFERGELDISTDKALQLMLRLGMNKFDLFPLYYRNRSILPIYLQDMIQRNDVGELRLRQSAFEVAHPQKNNMTELARVLYKAAINWPVADFQLSAEDEQVLADFLSVPPLWDSFEAQLFKSIIGPASHDLIAILWNRSDDSKGANREAVEMMRLMLWLAALANRDLELADQMHSEVADYIEPRMEKRFVMEYLPNYRFAVRLSKWIHKPSAHTAAPILAMIDGLESYHVNNDSMWLKLMFRHARDSEGPHRVYSLVDHPRSITYGHSINEVVKQRRLYLGLKVTDLEGVVSNTALRRFENGQTQLSFGAVARLSGELGILPSTIVILMSNSPEFSGGLDLFDTFYSVIGQHSALWNGINSRDNKSVTATEHEISLFTSQVPCLPNRVLLMQRFLLRQAAGLGDVFQKEMQQESPVVLKQLLEMRVWGILEEFLTFAVTPWLDVEQLTTLFAQVHRVLTRGGDTEVLPGSAFIFDGLNTAIIAVSAQNDQASALAFLDSVVWIMSITDPVPTRWCTVGSWLIARYLLVSSDNNLRRVHTYLRRTINVGHDDIIGRLETLWLGRIPDDFIRRTLKG